MSEPEPRRDVGYWWKAPLTIGALLAAYWVLEPIVGGDDPEAAPTPTSVPSAAPRVAKPVPEQPASPAAEGELVEVTRVVDGDSIHVRRGGETVKLRVVGLDTPEVGECWRDESSARAEELLDGETVRIQLDPSQDAVDRYGRELDDVWLPDGRLYAEVMVAGGHAHAYVYRKNDPNRYAGRIAAAEDDARDAGRGLWAAETCGGQP